MMPSASVLVGLSKTLGVSIDFLVAGQVETLKGVEFRKHSGTSARDRARVEVIVTEKVEDYLAIEDILELVPPADSFGDLVADRLESMEHIDDMAKALREKWRLGLDPIPSMSALLEDKGIKVIEADLPDRFDGMACDVKRSDGRPDTAVVVASNRTNIERKRFTLAHELAHRVIRSTGNPDIDLEKAMNRFAGAFLVPGEHLIEEAGAHRHGMTYRELVRLKHLYGISAVAILMRLMQVDILSKPVVEYAFRSYARTWRVEEPEPIRRDEGFGAFERPQRFERLVWRALGEHLIAPVRAAQFLRSPVSAIEQEIRGPHNELCRRQ